MHWIGSLRRQETNFVDNALIPHLFSSKWSGIERRGLVGGGCAPVSLTPDTSDSYHRPGVA